MSDSDELVPVSEARRTIIPRQRNGKPVARSTVWRWFTKGLYGVRLQIVYVGSVPMVSQRRLRTFFEEVTAIRQSSAQPATIDATEEELEAAGLR